MSNHYHIVLCIDEKRTKSWYSREVLKRWKAMYSLSFLTEKYYNYESLTKSELGVVYQVSSIKYQEVGEYHDRLMSLSWFMRGINEPVARRANAEDNSKGRFDDMLKLSNLTKIYATT